MAVDAVSQQSTGSINFDLMSRVKHKGPPKGGMNPTQMVDKMAKDLNLTDEQKTKITEIIQNNMKEMQTANPQSTTGESRDAMKAKMEANMEKLNKQIESVLTAEQTTKFESILKTMKNSRGMEMQNDNQSNASMFGTQGVQNNFQNIDFSSGVNVLI